MSTAGPSSQLTACEQEQENLEFDDKKLGEIKVYGDMVSLYLNENLSDVSFIVEGRPLYAHKLILSLRSVYFEDLPDLKNASQSTITVPDVSAQAFKKVLGFIYSGVIILSVEADMKLSLEVLDLAHKYKIFNLKTVMAIKLINVLYIENIFQLIQRARSCEMPEFIDKCLNFIDDNASEFLKRIEFVNQPEDLLVLILERDSFGAFEFDIFEAVERWCKRNGKLSSALIECVRFSYMTRDELKDKVRPTGLVTENTLIRAINDISEDKKSDPLRWAPLPDVNLASSKREVHFVNSKENLDYLVKGNRNNKKYTTIPIGDKEGLVVKFEPPLQINHIKILLRIGSENLCSGYYVELSRDGKFWKKVVDYTQYNCRGMQNLYFKSTLVQCVRIVGTYCSKDTTLDIVAFEALFKKHIPKIELDGVWCPSTNVALLSKDAILFKGSNYYMISGDKKLHNYTFQYIGFDCITIQLAQPYMINYIELYFYDTPQYSYKYYIETSINRMQWEKIIDKTDEFYKGLQVLTFQSRPVVYIRITGIEEKSKSNCLRCSWIEVYKRPYIRC